MGDHVIELADLCKWVVACIFIEGAGGGGVLSLYHDGYADLPHGCFEPQKLPATLN